MQRPTLGEINL